MRDDERDIEQALKRAVEQRGGICWKFTSPGTAGVPDRIALMPGGRIAFIEVKAPGKRPRPLQRAIHEKLRALGLIVITIDNKNQIPGALHAVQTS